MATIETGLINSRRRFNKVTYTPVQTEADPSATNEGPSAPSMGALNLAALIRTLSVTNGELQVLQGRSRDIEAAAGAVGAMIEAVSGDHAIKAAASLVAASEQLPAFVRQLGDLRSSASTSLATAATRLTQQHAAAAQPQPESPKYEPAPSLSAKAEGLISELFHAKQPEQIMSSDQPGPQSLTTAAAPKSAVGLTVPSDAVAWARQAQPALLDQVRAAAGQYLTALPKAEADIQAAMARLGKGVMATKLVEASLTQRPLQPIGLLHLERLDMTPISVERGELVYSLPLAPREKVTLAHREWTAREEEFQQFVQDYQENFSQQGVAQSDDISMATQAQSSHSNELSMGSQPSSTTPATITPPVSSATSSSTVQDQTSQATSRDQSRTVTSLASARTIRDQKISFTVTTVSGVQDFTAQVLENPHDDYSLRIDYYRRMRRWRSDLYRYGVRMTYDVVLPDPGALLRGRVDQVSDIDGQLSQPFTMDLAPGQLTPSTWQFYGNLYGVALAPPPEQSIRISASKVVGYDPPITITTGPDGAKFVLSHFSEELPVPIPGGYLLAGVHVDIHASTWTSGVGAQWVTVIAGDFVQNFDAGNSGFVNAALDVPIGSLATQGTVSVAFRLKGIATGELVVTATATASTALDEQWRQQAWTALRDKAYAEYLANLDRLRQQRASIVSEINNTDALTLRRLEREQVMRATLEWLFPGFGDASSVLEGLPDPSSLDTATWQKVMQYGEYIKFVQSAIDWDNVLVLLYPYFWDTLASQQEKLLLSHPDPLHREFLRAGAARVILAIQPGFESDVVSLLQQGQFGSLGEGTAFAKVANDVQVANAAYQKTTQPTEDNPDNPHPGGTLIGSWHDYTPTSALDIDVTRFQVLNGVA